MGSWGVQDLALAEADEMSSLQSAEVKLLQGCPRLLTLRQSFLVPSLPSLLHRQGRALPSASSLVEEAVPSTQARQSYTCVRRQSPG